MTRAWVVYESMYGNTQRIAQAIADGLSTHLKVGVVEVGTAPKVLPPDVGLVVVGGPTHTFGMSRAETRQGAATQGPVPLVSQGIGQREWLAEVVLEPSRVVAATFCTKVGKPRFFWGSAARRARKQLRRRGMKVVAFESFFVGFKQPEDALLAGEEARAQLWGDQLGADYVAGHTGHLHAGAWVEPPLAA